MGVRRGNGVAGFFLAAVLLMAACSPDPQPIKSARLVIEGIQKQDADRIERGLCLNVQRDRARMAVGPLMEAYLNDEPLDYNVRRVDYRIRSAETVEAVIEVKIPDAGTYYLLSTVEDRGWCICGDMLDGDWQRTIVRQETIRTCRGRP